MPRTEMKTRIYRGVDSPRDIKTINEKIRGQMGRADRREELTELKKRSDYLCALAESPSWKEKFGSTVSGVLRVAREENKKTTDVANRLAVRRGWEADYDPGGTDVLTTTRCQPSEARYSGGGKVSYLVYNLPALVRGGRRNGRSVSGVAAHYRWYKAQTRQAWRDQL